MNGSTIDEWHKELRMLLDHIQSNPSQDLTEKRERVIVLNRLIAAHAEKTTA
ncbi:MAG: hypothetical protein V4459_09000 [Pseudomonadota bacterium]